MRVSPKERSDKDGRVGKVVDDPGVDEKRLLEAKMAEWMGGVFKGGCCDRRGVRVVSQFVSGVDEKRLLEATLVELKCGVSEGSCCRSEGVRVVLFVKRSGEFRESCEVDLEGDENKGGE